MNTAKETAANMRKRYGRDAEIHCMYAIMGNEGTPAAAYWREVRDELDLLKREEKKR